MGPRGSFNTSSAGQSVTSRSSFAVLLEPTKLLPSGLANDCSDHAIEQTTDVRRHVTLIKSQRGHGSLILSPASWTLLTFYKRPQGGNGKEGPAPVTDVPAPVTDVPALVTDVPALVIDVPAPVTDVPAPVTDVPAPVTDVPAPVTDVPAPAPTFH